MSDISDIRAAVKATLSTHGLHVYDTMVDVAQTPAVLVEPYLAEYEVAFGMNSDRYEFSLYVLVANKNTAQAQRKLDEFLTGRGPKSIREFIFRNSSLGLDDVDANVTELIKGTYGGNFKVSTTAFVGGVLRLSVQII